MFLKSQARTQMNLPVRVSSKTSHWLDQIVVENSQHAKIGLAIVVLSKAEVEPRSQPVFVGPVRTGNVGFITKEPWVWLGNVERLSRDTSEAGSLHHQDDEK